MRIDYFAPVLGPTFRLRGELINDGRTTCLVATHFLDLDKLVYAITTLRKTGRLSLTGKTKNGRISGRF